jgi:hypothetical protein
MSYKITDENIQEATEAYRNFVGQMGKRYIHTSENLRALGDILEASLNDGENITLEHWLTAWVSASNQGLLKEPLSPEQEKALQEEKTKERNLRLEQKDRQAGATFVNAQGEVQKSHLSESEKEAMLEAAAKQSKEDYKKALEWVRSQGQRQNEPRPLDPSPIDAVNELNSLLEGVTISTATVEHKRAIKGWYKTTSTKNIQAVKRNHPLIAEKIEKILVKDFSQVDL